MKEEAVKLPEPDKMSEKIISKQKTGWWDLPLEMREMVIKKMDDATKLKFALCSDDFAVEMPKNYVKTLNIIRSVLYFQIDQEVSKIRLGFSATSVETCTITCARDPDTIIWQTEEAGNIVEVIAESFRKIMMNVTKLDRLDLKSATFPYRNTSVRHLKNIGRLKILERCPTDLFETGFIEPEQLLLVHESLFLTKFCLKLPQLQYLNSPVMLVMSAVVTSEDINQFLKMFQNGQVPERFEMLKMTFDQEQKLNFEKTVKGLNMLEKSVNDIFIKFLLKDKTNPERVAEILFELDWPTLTIKVLTEDAEAQHSINHEYINVIKQYLDSLGA